MMRQDFRSRFKEEPQREQDDDEGTLQVKNEVIEDEDWPEEEELEREQGELAEQEILPNWETPENRFECQVKNEPATASEYAKSCQYWLLNSHQRRSRANRARFILSKIAKNEAEGKNDPRDAEDKAKYLAEIAEYEAYKEAHHEAPKPVKEKRRRSQELSESAPKRARDSQGKARATSFVKKAKSFSEVARDGLAMALVDANNDDGRLLSEKWDEIEAKIADMVTDRLVAMPGGPIPSFDSSDMVRGHRVIRCDDASSWSFLEACVAQISDMWAGLKIRLVHASEIPRRPRARIWLPKGQTDHGRVISCLRVQNPDVHTEDWTILKAEREMKTSQPFLLLINKRCLSQLEKNDYKVRYGIRKAKIKVFLAEPDELLEEVDD